MALQGSGVIWLSQIQAEYGGPNYWLTTYYRGAGYVTANNGGVPTGGAIWFSQFYGTFKAFEGSYNRTSNGSATVQVPPHGWLRMRVWGAGGGGADVSANGANGGTSSVSGHLSATGGRGGISYNGGRAGGAGGTGSGGNTSNSTGGAGATAVINDGTGGRGGNCAGSGGSGGAGSRANTQAGHGGAPGGGGGGHGTSGGGGGGGYARSDYGADARYLSFSITVGNGGAGGGSYGGDGADGRVFIEWGI